MYFGVFYTQFSYLGSLIFSVLCKAQTTSFTYFRIQLCPFRFPRLVIGFFFFVPSQSLTWSPCPSPKPMPSSPPPPLTNTAQVPPLLQLMLSPTLPYLVISSFSKQHPAVQLERQITKLSAFFSLFSWQTSRIFPSRASPSLSGTMTRRTSRNILVSIRKYFR